MPPRRFSTNYTGPQDAQDEVRGFFYFRLLGLDSLISAYHGTPDGPIASIVQREISKELELLKADLEETYKGYAPYKEGPWDDEYKSTSTPPHGQYLRDSIQARKALKGTTLELRMAWWGKFTTDGRGAQGPRGKPYRIELPGGQVIYRNFTKAAYSDSTSAGPAGVFNAAGITGDRRQNWTKEAYDDLKKRGVFKQSAERMAQRIEYAIFRALAKAYDVKGARSAATEAFGRNPTRPNYASALRSSRDLRHRLRNGQSPRYRQRAKRGAPEGNHNRGEPRHRATTNQRYHQKHEQALRHTQVDHPQPKPLSPESYAHRMRKLYRAELDKRGGPRNRHYSLMSKLDKSYAQYREWMDKKYGRTTDPALLEADRRVFLEDTAPAMKMYRHRPRIRGIRY